MLVKSRFPGITGSGRFGDCSISRCAAAAAAAEPLPRRGAGWGRGDSICRRTRSASAGGSRPEIRFCTNSGAAPIKAVTSTSAPGRIRTTADKHARVGIGQVVEGQRPRGQPLGQLRGRAAARLSRICIPVRPSAACRMPATAANPATRRRCICTCSDSRDWSASSTSRRISGSVSSRSTSRWTTSVLQAGLQPRQHAAGLLRRQMGEHQGNRLRPLAGQHADQLVGLRLAKEAERLAAAARRGDRCGFVVGLALRPQRKPPRKAVVQFDARGTLARQQRPDAEKLLDHALLLLPVDVAQIDHDPPHLAGLLGGQLVEHGVGGGLIQARHEDGRLSQTGI